MNLYAIQSETVAGRRRRLDSIALVVTLLMLSVITFLAVAFLAMTERNRADVSGMLDVTTAQAMAAAAVGRAQGEILAQMLTHNDPLYYDYMVSRNYINPNGFNNSEKGVYDPNNVNYDIISTGAPFPASDQQGWVQNIANLWYDPRLPVFVTTNSSNNLPLDFRFYVDINRNGRFETNGYIPTVIDELGNTNGSAIWNGEPEFIGVLRNPLYPHSSTNRGIGRYAYLVLPVGKECDINYIGNNAKANYVNGVQLTNSFGVNDGFARDQGVGSWELNLAAMLDAVSPWAYEANERNYSDSGGTYINDYSPYIYTPPINGIGTPNSGSAFDDAQSILRYRDWAYVAPTYMASLFTTLPLYWTNNIDYYCVGGLLNPPFDYGTYTNPAPNAQPVKRSWAGSYSTNLFFDPQDLFNPTKTSIYFTNRMLVTGGRTNYNDRYTFERLISCLGMGSSPEYGVWVYNDADIPGTPTRLRTKVNINYDNTAQITNVNAPYVSMPTNLGAWKPLGFFTNAAELLLRSQTFMYTNYLGTNTNFVTGPLIFHFGVTNIPIYRTNQPGIRYNTSVHRMLQLAANIYDATNPTNLQSQNPVLPLVRHPTVFRPLFQITNTGTTSVGLNISGYALVTNDAYTQMLKPYQEMSNSLGGSFDTNGNVAGIPWVVAANSGLPEFNQYSYQSGILFERKLLFVRDIVNGSPVTNKPPHYTNQFYCMSISNNFGMNAWNSYQTAFTGESGTYCYFSNYTTIQFTNGYNYGYVTNLSNYSSPYTVLHWPLGVATARSKLQAIFQTNVTTLPPAYFSEAYKTMVLFTNGIITSNSFLPADTTQQGWPVHNWTLNITNHVVYALFDGIPGTPGAHLLDFVNLGPFGSSTNIQQYLNATNVTTSPGSALGANGGASGNNYWASGNATDLPGSPMSAGLIEQIATTDNNSTYIANLNGQPGGSSDMVFAPPYEPSNVLVQSEIWVVNDPLVHYTTDDLTWPGNTDNLQSYTIPPFPLLTNSLAQISKRYAPWGASYTEQTDMLFKDPLITGSADWQFPTNKFPGVGWIGRVHRGTPWQTVYLKADNPAGLGSPAMTWTNLWVNSPWFSAYESSPETYPTNDWGLVDVFTTAPNDNAARGLLSVNQTNEAAWAAAFAGVIAITNADGGQAISVSNALILAAAINEQRTNQPNGIYHKVGYILGTPALTTAIGSPFLSSEAAVAENYTDADYERIPQQTLSLLRVGEPQFVIFAWGQALRPKGISLSSPNQGICTNYEITGEFLSRTVCHLVHTNGLKMVIDSYNIEPSN
jgi:hypothetical protein